MSNAPIYMIPTANPKKCAETFLKWKDRGYQTAALVDGEMEQVPNADITIRIPVWQGYPYAIKVLADVLMKEFPEVEWLVTGGDDIDPDPNTLADVIANQCTRHFNGTMGVMQPCGDDWGKNQFGVPAAARICGSPWMGREFCQRWNHGNGPFHLGHYHYFCDESLKEETEMEGVLWQRFDLSQTHHHWHRTSSPRPDYMNKAQLRWAQDEALFRERKKNRFPGHEPLPA